MAANADGRGVVDVNSFQNEELANVAAIVCHTSGCMGLKVDKNFSRMAIGASDFSISLWNLADLVCYATVFIELVLYSIYIVNVPSII